MFDSEYKIHAIKILLSSAALIFGGWRGSRMREGQSLLRISIPTSVRRLLLLSDYSNDGTVGLVLVVWNLFFAANFLSVLMILLGLDTKDVLKSIFQGANIYTLTIGITLMIAVIVDACVCEFIRNRKRKL